MDPHSPPYRQLDNWKLPLNLAVGFHLLVAFSLLTLPGLFNKKPIIEDSVMVNLVTMSDLQAPAPAPPAPNITQQQAVSTPDNNLASSPVKPVPAPVPEPVQAVSIKPVKRKIVKKVTQQPRQRDLEKISRERLAQALQAEKLAAEQARIAAREAERQSKLMAQSLAAISRQASSSAAPSPRPASGPQLSALQQQYYLAIVNHVTQHWSVPEFQIWDPGLQTVVVITISRNGTIINQFIEKKSGNPTFDQFVRRTLKDAAPLPAMPKALRENKFEVGLRFYPEGIN